MTHNPVRPWRNIDRRPSRRIHVGSVPVGDGAPISVQTMTNTLTTDVAATVAQIDLHLLEEARDLGADAGEGGQLGEEREEDVGSAHGRGGVCPASAVRGSRAGGGCRRE